MLHGASKVALPTVQNRLLQLEPQTEQVIALLDPDVAGRQARLHLDKLLPGQVLHAFIPGWHATAFHDIRSVIASPVVLYPECHSVVL